MRIFISYRHSDAIAGTALTVFDRLARLYGKEHVFLDNASLPVAESFPDQIQARLHDCDIFLALIDRHWLASTARLHETQDWVRRELDVALQRRADGLRLIPVLLHGARMPTADGLPPSLALLADLQAPPPLRSASLAQDIALLTYYIDGWTLEQMQDWLAARTRAAWRVVAAVVVLGLLTIMSGLDRMNVDTRLEALTMSVADVIADTQPHERLAMVEINAQTELALGKPLLSRTANGGLAPELSWRADHATLIDRLSAAGARVIAFDITMSLPSPVHDALLQAAARRANERGTAVIFGAPPSGQPPLLAPPDALSTLLCVGEKLESSRTVPLVVRRSLGNTGGPAANEPSSLAVVLGGISAIAALTPNQVRVAEAADRRLTSFWPSGWPLPRGPRPTTTVNDARACPALVKGDVVDELYLRFSPLAALRDPVRRHRYEDVLAGGTAFGTARWRDQIVLVGVGALQAGAVDQFTVLHGLQREQRMGFEVHADAINTLLNDITIQRVPSWLQNAVLLPMAVLGMVGRFWRRLWAQRRGLWFCVAVAAGNLTFSAWLCARENLLLDSPFHIAATLLAYWMSDRMLRHQGFWLGGRRT